MLGYLSIRFFHQSHNTVHFGGLFTLKQWIFSSLKHDPVPRENKLYCFYVKNSPKRIALWDRENSQWTLSVLRSEQFSKSEAQGKLSATRTNNVQGQISEHIFTPNGGYCLYYPSNLFCNARSFENWGIFSDIPQFWLGIFGHVTCLDQSRVSEKI